jgi:hypothetical protein
MEGEIMKRTILIFILFISFAINGKGNEFVRSNLFIENAFSDSIGKFELSLFKLSSYQLKDNIKLKAHPLYLFLNPTIEVNWIHKENTKSAFASYHKLSYPTLMLNFIKKEGTLGIISNEFDIPQMVAIGNGIIYSSECDNGTYWTAEVGIEFSLGGSELDERTVIDLPVVAPRDEVYYRDYGFNAALSTEGPLAGKFRYAVMTEGFYFLSDDSRLYWENSFKLVWKISPKFRLCGGAFLCYGQYEFGNQWHLLPALDFKWDFK